MKKIALNLFIVAAAIATGCYLSRGPYKVLADQQAKTQQQIKATRNAERDTEDLVRRDAQAHTPTGKEELARQAGFVKEGEKPANP